MNSTKFGGVDMKKLLAIIFTIMMLSSFCLSANAAPHFSGLTGALEYNEDICGPVSREEIVALNEKMSLLETIEKEQPATRATTWSHLPGTFTLYFQTTNYNCGPACVQSTIKYINGSAPAQSTVATGCKTTTNGTYLSDMVAYLNSKQTENRYVSVYQEDNSTFSSCLYSAVHYLEVPAIVGFACSTSDGWAYNSGGHFTCINAARDDKGAFQLADPLIGYLGGSTHFYQKSITDLYEAYDSVNIGFSW